MGSAKFKLNRKEFIMIYKLLLLIFMLQACVSSSPGVVKVSQLANEPIASPLIQQLYREPWEGETIFYDSQWVWDNTLQNWRYRNVIFDDKRKSILLNLDYSNDNSFSIIVLSADDKLNMYGNTVNALTVSVVQLSDINVFERAVVSRGVIANILDGNNLGGSVISSSPQKLLPSSNSVLKIELDSKTRYIALMSGYFNSYFSVKGVDHFYRIIPVPVKEVEKSFIGKMKGFILFSNNEKVPVAKRYSFVVHAKFGPNAIDEVYTKVMKL